MNNTTVNNAEQFAVLKQEWVSQNLEIIYENETKPDAYPCEVIWEIDEKEVWVEFRVVGTNLWAFLF